MGKEIDDMPKPARRPAPITPETAGVKAAGQQKVSELQKRKGRSSTFFSDLGMRTGFAGGTYGEKTGSV